MPIFNLVMCAVVICLGAQVASAQDRKQFLEQAAQNFPYDIAEEYARSECFELPTKIAHDTCVSNLPAEIKALKANMLHALGEGLNPTMVLLSASSGSASAMSHTGGMPDVGPDFVWPLSPVTSISEASEWSGGKGPRHLMDDLLPMTFVAQLDLAQVASAVSSTSRLPEQGRLLFFYDPSLGDAITVPATVIWDQTPQNDLRQAALPEVLVTLDKTARKSWLGFLANLGGSDEPYNPGFIAPMLRKSPTELWLMPSPNTIEASGTKLDQIMTESEVAYMVYYDWLYAFDSLETDGNTWAYAHTKILGSPDPEQDDPRLSIGSLEDYNKNAPSGEGLNADQQDDAQIAARYARDQEIAKNWRVLLQIQIPALLEINSEGTLYYLIHEDDLRQQDFSKVITIYQQT